MDFQLRNRLANKIVTGGTDQNALIGEDCDKHINKFLELQ